MSRRASSAMRGCKPPSARIWRAPSRRSAGACSASWPPRSSAATAIANSCSEPSVIERLDIARVGRRGDGIAETPAGPLYVPSTRPGEPAEVDAWPGHPDRRHLVKIEAASRERIAAICPHFGTCGGCALQHWAPAPYRDWKRGLVVEALAEMGFDAAIGELVDPLIDAHGEGRRRAVFHAWRRAGDVLEVGFAALRAHHVVAIDHCPVLAPSLNGAIEVAW